MSGPRHATDGENQSSKTPKIFCDPVHGHIELHPLLVKMIDTPQFQRLRHLKQLGLKYLVFPGATHTRFAHSIGVAYLAGCLLKHLEEKQPELKITKRDSLCVQIAALCHDMGHGPFSHLFDDMFIHQVLPGTDWKHEQASADMFDFMRKKNRLDNMMKEHGLNLDEDIIFIKELINGLKTSDNKWTARGRPENKSFLYEIVANKVNGIDVDKWDYLARDCHYLGIPNGFDQQRLLKSARVLKVDGRYHICFRDKIADNIYGMFHTRYTLHRQVLQHKTGYIIDVMVKEALVKANEKLWPDRKISDAKDHMAEYVKLTDHIFDQILNQSESEDLREAQKILEDIVNRRLPKFVGEARLDVDKLDDTLGTHRDKKATRRENYQGKMQQQLRDMIPQSLNHEHFDVYVVDMGFGEVGKDPIDNVHFYSKSDPNEPFKMEKNQVSRLKPTRFHEYIVRLYCKKNDASDQMIQKAHERFHTWCTRTEFVKTSDPVHGDIELHPLLVKMIDTPQFQKFRHIKQLGLKYLVFPGATHTRFAHSIGVAYLAGCLLKHLEEKQPELEITKRDSLCVQIAALCHDMGHGPFSHLFDEMFIHQVLPGTDWKHEQASADMFYSMMNDNGLREMMTEHGLHLDEDITFIKELINGHLDDKEWTAEGRPENKSFLYEIVANKVNGIDVDKWDYLARHCHYLGIPNGFDHQRLLKSARVLQVDGRYHICFRDKVADNIYGMFHTRYTLHRQVLQHKTGYIIDVMVKDALVKAKEKLWPGRKISDAKDHMAEYIKLTDHIFDQILNQSESEDLREEDLEDIVKRRLPKFVGEARLDVDKLDDTLETHGDDRATRREKYQNEMRQQLRDMIPQSLNHEDFDVYVVDMGFGEVGKDPIDNVHFYSKSDPNKPFKMEKKQVSRLKPTRFHEYIVRLYCKKNDASDEMIQNAHEGFHTWCTRTEFVKTSGEVNPNKIFHDSIHGQIELEPLLVKIIDTPEFQRLRNIKQLGGADRVYPGATHTRFEHSLGMAYLAGQMINILKEKQPDLNINDRDVLCVKIAALCYNLGHGPFSYVYKRYCDRILDHDVNWKRASIWIFLSIVENNEDLRRELNADLNFIKDLIEGNPQNSPDSKAFLYEIVCNKWNGIDVRRWDYFARDCHHLGIPNSFDHQRLLKTARVCDVNGEKHICFRDKVADNIYDMFHTRYNLYLQAYEHKIVNIIEDKIIDAFLQAQYRPELLLVPESITDHEIQTKIENIHLISPTDRRTERLIKLTDHIFERILYHEELIDAKKELEDVVVRRLPKCVGEIRLTESEKNKVTFKKNWNTALREWTKRHPAVFLDKNNFSTDVIHLGYDKSLKNTYFYKKNDHNKTLQIEEYERSSLWPKTLSEDVGRVYCMKKKDEKYGKECFQWWRLGVILVYDQEDFTGNERLITEDYPFLVRCGIKEIRSCKVLSGFWELCEGCDYRAPKYQLKPGKEYQQPEAWSQNNSNASALSIRRPNE